MHVLERVTRVELKMYIACKKIYLFFQVVLHNSQYRIKYATCFGLNKPLSGIQLECYKGKIETASRCEVSYLCNVTIQFVLYRGNVKELLHISLDNKVRVKKIYVCRVKCVFYVYVSRVKREVQ